MKIAIIKLIGFLADRLIDAFIASKEAEIARIQRKLEDVAKEEADLHISGLHPIDEVLQHEDLVVRKQKLENKLNKINSL